MFEKLIIKSILYGVLASGVLLGVYFVVLTLVSGWSFTQSQFAQFRYFIVGLAVGFGIQVGLYSYLRGIILGQKVSGGVVAVSGTTSTVAMISCCAHYLANLLPILGTVGIITFVAQYQIELFWIGLVANAFGIWYVANKIRKVLRMV